ncbi:MAG: hypothetical protein A2Z29_04800 [Chloroflexi bacterium RBG_16_56_11]|nr:MAG: hypothetical protein A2Z29_04800 [Chloroflexi bacterium RBG_16_56_11]
MAPKQYEVVIKLIDNKSPCHSGHKIGDQWVFDYMTPPGMCGLAFNAIYPVALALEFGATFPWQEDPDVLTIACPDAGVSNIFELRRRQK